MRGLLSVLLVCAGVLAWPSPAYAHTALKDAAPGPGDKVASGADVIALTFEGIRPGSRPRIDLLGPDQAVVATGEAVAFESNGADVVCAAVNPLGEGAHTVRYTIEAPDGEVQTSKYFFTVAAGTKPAVAPSACSGASLPAPSAAVPAGRFEALKVPVTIAVIICAGFAVAELHRARRKRRRQHRHRRRRREASAW